MEAVIGKRYRHYKGEEYVVLNIANHSETLEELVVYEAQYDDSEFGNNAVWVRPRAMFEEEIDIDGKMADRFGSVDQDS